MDYVQIFCLAVLLLICGGAAWVDLRQRLIPNFLIGWGLVAALLASLTECLLNDCWGAVGRLAAGTLAALLHWIPYAKGLMGAGDLKLALVVGLLLGWGDWSLYLGCYGLVLLLTAAFLLAFSKKSRQLTLPLAPFMTAAYLICLLQMQGRWCII